MTEMMLLFYSSLHWRQVVVPVQEIIFQTTNAYINTKYNLTDSNKSNTTISCTSGATNATNNLSSNYTYLRRIRPRSNSPLPHKLYNKQNSNFNNNNNTSNYNDNNNTTNIRSNQQQSNANSNISTYSDVNLNLLSNANNK
jgi:hypothetical protein